MIKFFRALLLLGMVRFVWLSLSAVRTGQQRTMNWLVREADKAKQAWQNESRLQTRRFNYDNSSFSIYKKRAAIEIAGKTSPTRGTSIEGRYKFIIENTF